MQTKSLFSGNFVRLIQVYANNIAFTLKLRLFLCRIIFYLQFLRYFLISIRSLFYFCVFPYIIMYILNISKAIKKMSINEIKDFIFENYYKRIGFSKESSYCLMKRLQKKENCYL